MDDKISGFNIDNILRNNMDSIFGIPADNSLDNNIGSDNTGSVSSSGTNNTNNSCGCHTGSNSCASTGNHTTCSVSDDNDMSENTGSCGCGNIHDSSMPGSLCVGYGYVPWQMMDKVYQPEDGLTQGTVFPELNLSISEYGKVCKSGGI